MKKIFAILLALSFIACTEEKWTEKDKQKFIDDCVAEAPADSLIPIQKEMCKCMLDKIIEKYPSYQKANKEMKDEEINKVAEDCANEVLK